LRHCLQTLDGLGLRVADVKQVIRPTIALSAPYKYLLTYFTYLLTACRITSVCIYMSRDRCSKKTEREEKSEDDSVGVWMLCQVVSGDGAQYDVRV